VRTLDGGRGAAGAAAEDPAREPSPSLADAAGAAASERTGDTWRQEDARRAGDAERGRCELAGDAEPREPVDAGGDNDLRLS
jgi:hypothetical protein